MLKVNDIIIEVIAEMNRQLEKWGVQKHGDYYWMGILGEEYGESCKALIENSIRSYVSRVSFSSDGPSKTNVVIDRPTNPQLRKKLVQVAAVAMSWIGCIDRRDKDINFFPRDKEWEHLETPAP